MRLDDEENYSLFLTRSITTLWAYTSIEQHGRIFHECFKFFFPHGFLKALRHVLLKFTNFSHDFFTVAIRFSSFCNYILNFFLLRINDAFNLGSNILA